MAKVVAIVFSIHALGADELVTLLAKVLDCAVYVFGAVQADERIGGGALLCGAGNCHRGEEHFR